jgi:hypothetical protein
VNIWRRSLRTGVVSERQSDKLLTVVISRPGEQAKSGNRLPKAVTEHNRARFTLHWLIVTTQLASPPEKIEPTLRRNGVHVFPGRPTNQVYRIPSRNGEPTGVVT